MEELFRDAAEKYPLKTEGVADWRKISDSLQNEDGTAFAGTGEFRKEKKRRIFFWWILLLPLGWIGHESWQKLNSGSENKQNAIAKVSEISTNNNLSEKTNKESEAKKINAQKKAHEVAEHKNINASVISISTNKAKTPATENRITENTDNKNFVAKKTMDKTIDVKKIIDDRKKINSNINNSEIYIISGNNQVFTCEKPTGSHQTNNITNNLSSDIAHDVSNKDNENAIQKNSDSANTKTPRATDDFAKKADKPVGLAIVKKETKATVKLTKDFHFYAALIAGADVSTVKFQSIKAMGNSVGLLFGYHAGKSRINIETGVYWDTKKYYTNGEYFNTSKIQYFNGNPNIQLENVNGSCNMFEIPINVRYNVLQNKNTSLFVLAGISSYLMSKESYHYTGIESGWQWQGDASYYHSTQNWFSILNLSAGYEHRLGKIGDIRIEPYAKLPLSGIGVGSLSISSLGLNVGLSKRF
jgi:hypothetical protein